MKLEFDEWNGKTGVRIKLDIANIDNISLIEGIVSKYLNQIRTTKSALYLPLLKEELKNIGILINLKPLGGLATRLFLSSGLGLINLLYKLLGKERYTRYFNLAV